MSERPIQVGSVMRWILAIAAGGMIALAYAYLLGGFCAAC